MKKTKNCSLIKLILLLHSATTLINVNQVKLNQIIIDNIDFIYP